MACTHLILIANFLLKGVGIAGYEWLPTRCGFYKLNLLSAS